MSIKNISFSSSECYLKLSQLQTRMGEDKKKGRTDYNLYLQKIHQCLDEKGKLQKWSEQEGILTGDNKSFVEKTFKNIDTLAASLTEKANKCALMRINNISTSASQCYQHLSQLQTQMREDKKKGRIDYKLYLQKIHQCLNEKHELQKLSEQKGISTNNKPFIETTFKLIDALSASLTKKADKYALRMITTDKDCIRGTIDFDDAGEKHAAGSRFHPAMFPRLADKYELHNIAWSCSGYLVPIKMCGVEDKDLIKKFDRIFNDSLLEGYLPSFLCRENPICFTHSKIPFHFEKTPDFDAKLNKWEATHPGTSIQKKATKDNVFRANVCPALNSQDKCLKGDLDHKLLSEWTEKYLKNEKDIRLLISKDEEFLPVQTDDLNMLRLFKQELNQPNDKYFYLPASLCNQKDPTISFYFRGNRVELIKTANPLDSSLSFEGLEIKKNTPPDRLQTLLKQPSLQNLNYDIIKTKDSLKIKIDGKGIAIDGFTAEVQCEFHENHLYFIAKINSKKQLLERSENEKQLFAEIDKEKQSLAEIDKEKQSLGKIENARQLLERIKNEEQSLAKIRNEKQSLEKTKEATLLPERIGIENQLLAKIEEENQLLAKIANNNQLLGKIKKEKQLLAKIENRKQLLATIDNEKQALATIGDKEQFLFSVALDSIYDPAYRVREMHGVYQFTFKKASPWQF